MLFRDADPHSLLPVHNSGREYHTYDRCHNHWVCVVLALSGGAVDNTASYTALKTYNLCSEGHGLQLWERIAALTITKEPAHGAGSNKRTIRPLHCTPSLALYRIVKALPSHQPMLGRTWVACVKAIITHHPQRTMHSRRLPSSGRATCASYTGLAYPRRLPPGANSSSSIISSPATYPMNSTMFSWP